MTRAHLLPERTRAVLAEQLSKRMTTFGLDAVGAGEQVAIAEDFPMWTLGFDAVVSGKGNLSEIAHRTGYWYHQVQYGDAAHEFAASAPFGPNPEDWKVHALITSYLPGKVEAAITWLDEREQSDALVNMLAVPAYALHAFWWNRATDTGVVVVDMPQSFQHLQYQQIYTGDEFLAALRLEHRIDATPPEPPP